MCKKITAIVMLGSWSLLLAAAGAIEDIPEDLPAASRVPEDPFNWVDYTYEGDARFKTEPVAGQDGRVSLHETRLSLAPFALPLSESLTFAPGVGLRWIRFDFKDVPWEPKQEDVYDVTLPLLLAYDRRPWLVLADVTPGLFTDMDHVTSEDYRTHGYAMGMYEMWPAVHLALGAAYDREFGEDKLYPLAGVDWFVGPAWELRILFPEPAVRYAPTDRWLLFSELRPAGGLWNIKGNESDSDFKLEGYRLGLGAEYNVYKALWVRAAGGLAFGRKYEIRELGQTLLDSEADDTYYLQAALQVRL